MASGPVDKFELFALLPEHRLALCITPKAASMSINDALHRHYGAQVRLPSHSHSVFRWFTLEQVREVVPDWRVAQFVRHPMDRLRSVYDYHITRHHLERSANMRERFHSGMTFSEFVDQVVAEPHWDSHFMPQSDMADRVDFLGKFESLEDDWRVFRVWSGISSLPNLNHVNANRTSDGCSMTELTPYQRGRLNQIYAEDFKRFGYQP